MIPIIAGEKPIKTKKASKLCTDLKIVFDPEFISQFFTTPKPQQYTVAVCAALEYLAAEILELAGNCARDLHKQRITREMIVVAIFQDEELSETFKYSRYAKWDLSVYIKAVLKQVHPDNEITPANANILNCLLWAKFVKYDVDRIDCIDCIDCIDKATDTTVTNETQPAKEKEVDVSNTQNTPLEQQLANQPAPNQPAPNQQPPDYTQLFEQVTRKILIGEVGKHAMSEANKIVRRFNAL